MSEGQSDRPGPLEVDTARDEVIYHHSVAESSLSPDPLITSGIDDETPAQSASPSKNRLRNTSNMSCTNKKLIMCLVGTIVSGVVVCGLIWMAFIFWPRSSNQTTTFVPKAPMAPAAPTPPMEPPLPTGPVDPICQPSNIPEAFYNATGRFPEEGLYFLPCVNAFRFNVELMTQVKNRKDEGVWDRENLMKPPVGGVDAYKKYSIEYALALARDTNVTYDELDGYWGKDYDKVKCFSMRKANDALPSVTIDCDIGQAVYTDSSTEADRAIISPEGYLHYTQCRVLLFALVFGEFKSVMLEVANHTAGRENRFYFVETFFPLVEKNDRAGLVDFINGVGLDLKQALKWVQIILKPAVGFLKRLKICMQQFNPIPGQSFTDCIMTTEERERFENADRSWYRKGYVDGRGEVDPRSRADGRGKRDFEDDDF